MIYTATGYALLAGGFAAAHASDSMIPIALGSIAACFFWALAGYADRPK